MTRTEFMKTLTGLAETARSTSGLEATYDLLRIALVIGMYPPPVQSAIATECSAVTTKWAQWLRSALDAYDHQDQIEWALTHEWPEDLE